MAGRGTRSSDASRSYYAKSIRTSVEICRGPVFIERPDDDLHISSQAVARQPIAWLVLFCPPFTSERSGRGIRSSVVSRTEVCPAAFPGSRARPCAYAQGKRTIRRSASEGINRRELEAIVRFESTRLASSGKLFHGGRNRGSTSSRATTLKNEHRGDRSVGKTRPNDQSEKRNPVSCTAAASPALRHGVFGIP